LVTVVPRCGSGIAQNSFKIEISEKYDIFVDVVSRSLICLGSNSIFCERQMESQIDLRMSPEIGRGAQQNLRRISGANPFGLSKVK
jgi:hypothetical protein